jgi:hypothetical protein
MTRLKHYVENIGRGNFLRMALVASVFGLIGAMFAPARPTLVLALILFVAAGMLRNRLVDNFETVLPITQKLWMVVAGGAMVAGFLPTSNPWKMTAFYVLVPLVGLYIGIHFWTFSDPRIGHEE